MDYAEIDTQYASLKFLAIDPVSNCIILNAPMRDTKLSHGAEENFVLGKTESD